MKSIKPKFTLSNILFGLFIVLMIIPQSRQFIQIQLQKGLSVFSPSIEDEDERIQLQSYQWTLQDVNGNIYDFSSARNKVVFINFWATWCPPCIAEMSDLNQLYSDYNDKVEFLFVTNDDSEKVKAFLTKNGYSLEVYYPMSNHPDFEVSSIPRTFLIDKNGKIVIDKTGVANWNGVKVRATLDKLLND
ncbi:hypothetical protein C7H62_2004 [Mesoflavibacter sp. HG96]|uniref:TlpA family protein disulfide reductase n=1 Tax=unclassified Mesoflavibacter TaxID=2630131 RepID=UPI000D0FBDD5|nr:MULTISPECIES: TlpA disulfide reductase family protein [unclassified Mesoflavibacter]QIJ89813.1 hypothetical protein C7H62_2004 [Mesoflavibacter sp. HG96]QIJ92541.1 hypothetical protein C7H56_2004 [Mesoflavibacter sp. HG37]